MHHPGQRTWPDRNSLLLMTSCRICIRAKPEATAKPARKEPTRTRHNMLAPPQLKNRDPSCPPLPLRASPPGSASRATSRRVTSKVTARVSARCGAGSARGRSQIVSCGRETCCRWLPSHSAVKASSAVLGPLGSCHRASCPPAAVRCGVAASSSQRPTHAPVAATSRAGAARSGQLPDEQGQSQAKAGAGA